MRGWPDLQRQLPLPPLRMAALGVLIAIASVTGVSIAALFTGGLLPAVVLGLLLCVVVGFRSRRENLEHARRAPWTAMRGKGC